MGPTTFEAGPAAFAEELRVAQRRVALAEARVAGLIRAQVADTSVLWYARDPERQRAFEAAFAEGRALLNGTWEGGSGRDGEEEDDTLG